MTLPALLTSFSACPPDVWENWVWGVRVTAVNFSVCVVLWALATAGSRTAPVPPSTTAAPAAAMDVRIFMEYLRVSGRPIWDRPLMGVLGSDRSLMWPHDHIV